MESKYKGIDGKDIKCCCNEPNCIEGGITIEDNWLFFRFIEIIKTNDKEIIHQASKAMILNRQTRDELVKQLKAIKF